MWKQVLVIGLVTAGFSQSQLQADETKKETDEKVVTQSQVFGIVEEVDAAEPERAKDRGSKLWLGIALKNIEGDLAVFLGDDHGVLVDEVQPDSPAAQAGLKRGDILLTVDGKRLQGPAELLEVMQSASEDQELVFSVLRKLERLEMSVTPAPRPKSAILRFSMPELAKGLEALEGLGEFRMEFGGKPGDAERILMFRLADPSAFVTAKSIKLEGDFKVQTSIESDGETVELTVSRTSDQPVEIIVKRGDDVQKLSEQDIDQLPEFLREVVKSVLGGENEIGGQPNLGQFRDAKDLQGIFQVEEIRNLLDRTLGEGFEELKERLAEQGGIASEKAKELAKKNAEQAMEAARQWSQQAEQQLKRGESSLRAQMEQSVQKEQIAELKRQVEQLRQEIQALRSGQDSSDTAEPKP